MRVHRALAAVLLSGCGSRAELSAEVPLPERLGCGLVIVRARTGRSQTLVASVPPRLVGRVRWEIAEGPAGASLTAEASGRARFLAEAEGDYRIRVRADGAPQPAESCEIAVIVRGTAPGASCPEVVTATASEPLSLRGSVRSALPLAEGRWHLSATPVGSARPPIETDDAYRGRFVPDVVGSFVARFEVVDAQGERDSCSTRIESVPGPGLRVELWWTPPGRRCPNAEGAACDGADLDLHLLRVPTLRGWGSDDDCHFANCNTAAGAYLPWGGPGGEDDPRLVRDDVSGHGPEVIVVPAPATGLTRVGVHYFASHGAGPQEATVAVFCAGNGITLGPLRLTDGFAGGGAFTRVAEIEHRATGCVIRAAPGTITPWDEARGRDAP